MKAASLLAALCALALLPGCFSEVPNGLAAEPDAGVVISIQGYAYSPLDLVVDAGTVIAVHNLDEHTHTLTTEPADNAFVPGAVDGIALDTGLVDQDRWATVTVPASAPSGLILPYYCTTHGSGMTTPNGHITVR